MAGSVICGGCGAVVLVALRQPPSTVMVAVRHSFFAHTHCHSWEKVIFRKKQIPICGGQTKKEYLINCQFVCKISEFWVLSKGSDGVDQVVKAERMWHRKDVSRVLFTLLGPPRGPPPSYSCPCKGSKGVSVRRCQKETLTENWRQMMGQ